MKIVSLSCVVFLVSALVVVGGCSDDSTTSADASVDAASTTTSDASVAPSPDAGKPVVVPSPGNCTFTVDGATFTSSVGDVFTTAVLSGDSLTVQCVAVLADVRHTVNLAVAGVTGPGASKAGLGQYSTQPATGGTATQYRAFDAIVTVASTTPTISGTSTFKATGSASKSVTVSFNLAPK